MRCTDNSLLKLAVAERCLEQVTGKVRMLLKSSDRRAGSQRVFAKCKPRGMCVGECLRKTAEKMILLFRSVQQVKVALLGTTHFNI